VGSCSLRRGILKNLLGRYTIPICLHRMSIWNYSPAVIYHEM
jgi:hypothetical protein